MIQLFASLTIPIEAPPPIDSVGKVPYSVTAPIEAISAPPLVKIEELAEVPTQIVTVNPRAYYASTGNTYEPGQCVWGVKEWRPDIPNGWGNANQWLYSAQAQGWQTGTVPRVNAVGTKGNHVVLVLAVKGDIVTIREMNYDWVPFHERTIDKPANLYIYIY